MIDWNSAMSQVPTQGYEEYFDRICAFGKGFKHLDQYRRNLLMAYVWRARPINTSAAKFLINKGSLANHVDEDGCTCLHHAV